MDWLDLILKVKLFSLKVKWQATNWIIMLATYTFHKRLIFRDFPGLVVKTTLPLQGAWFDPWLGLPWWLSWWRIHLQCRRPWFDSWVGKIPWRRDRLPTPVFWASLVAQMVKNLPAMRETWLQCLDWEDSHGGGHGNPLHYSRLENPHKPGMLQSMGSQRVGHDWATKHIDVDRRN